MSQNPTKAADNAFCIARKNAAAWSEALNSREGASELLCIDRTRIARIELGSLIPYPEEVLLMADGYNAPELLNHYCSTLCPIGCRTQQKLDVAGLDRLVVKLVSAFRKDDSLGDILLDITEGRRDIQRGNAAAGACSFTAGSSGKDHRRAENSGHRKIFRKARKRHERTTNHTMSFAKKCQDVALSKRILQKRLEGDHLMFQIV